MTEQQNESGENCQTSCKRRGYIPNKSQRELLARVYKIQQESGFAIRNDFKYLSHRKFYYSVNKLKENGYVENTSKAVYNLKATLKGKQFLETLFADLQNNSQSVNISDRAHNITLKCAYRVHPSELGCFSDWKIKNCSGLNWAKNQYYKRIDDCLIHINPKHILLTYTDVFASDSHLAVMFCINKSLRLLSTVLSACKPDLPSIVLVCQHHALSCDSLADFTSRYNIHYTSERLVFDRSISKGEFELVSPEHSADDFTRLTDFFESVIRGDFSAQTIIDLQKMLQKQEEEVKIVNGES
jgi:hypothetical protein